MKAIPITAGLLLASSLYAQEKPNIVVYLADDHGCAQSEPYGDTFIKTPKMQELADQGMFKPGKFDHHIRTGGFFRDLFSRIRSQPSCSFEWNDSRTQRSSRQSSASAPRKSEDGQAIARTRIRSGCLR